MARRGAQHEEHTTLWNSGVNARYNAEAKAGATRDQVHCAGDSPQPSTWHMQSAKPEHMKMVCRQKMTWHPLSRMSAVKMSSTRTGGGGGLGGKRQTGGSNTLDMKFGGRILALLCNNDHPTSEPPKSQRKTTPTTRKRTQSRNMHSSRSRSKPPEVSYDNSKLHRRKSTVVLELTSGRIGTLKSYRAGVLVEF